MHYEHMTPGIFLSRPNRFIAHIEIDGQEEICHVKNTGRCRELLPRGAKVYCQRSDNPSRKTKYDLISVRKGDLLINMDSQAPNAAAKEWLAGGGLGPIENLRPETKHGDSRFDFSKTASPAFWRSKAAHWSRTASAPSPMPPPNGAPNTSEA